MATLLAAASSSVKLLVGQGEPSIDNWTFRLFYQWTTGLLLASSVIVTSNQFFGTPIECDLVRRFNSLPMSNSNLSGHLQP